MPYKPNLSAYYYSTNTGALVYRRHNSIFTPLFFTVSCGGSHVEADRIADGDSVAISRTGSVAFLPLGETDADCSPTNGTGTLSQESQQTVITIYLTAGSLRAATTFRLTKTQKG